MTDLFALVDATWPAERRETLGGWTLRLTKGAGNRVSAASWQGDGTPDIDAAADAMRAHGQSPLFQVRAGQDALDAALEAAGYVVKDETVALSVPCETIAAVPPPVTCFEIWPPLAIQIDLWSAAGIGPARIGVMERVAGPKTSLFGRIRDKPAGAAFVAIHDGKAMLHALDIASEFRRAGLGRIMMATAAHWAAGSGATDLLVLVTRRNLAANGLYASMGFQPVGHYHYRTEPEAP
ncbi:GNAT family N-acetyltransferase [Rhodobacterales bacterium HKCCE3408]|nr:GNAT family N-acetyltransferase [Rhodobacterales bacterium HKCCE3408]